MAEIQLGAAMVSDGLLAQMAGPKFCHCQRQLVRNEKYTVMKYLEVGGGRDGGRQKVGGGPSLPTETQLQRSAEDFG